MRKTNQDWEEIRELIRKSNVPKEVKKAGSAYFDKYD